MGRVLYVADSALDFAFCLIERAFGLKLGVASGFTSRLLDGAYRLVGSAVDAVIIHESSFRVRLENVTKSGPFPWSCTRVGTCVGRA
jgi:hypothetical protein